MGLEVLQMVDSCLQDEAAGITLKPSRLSSSTAAVSSSKPDELSVSSTAEAARQLTKCKFKSCKLLFASDLNKNRCHMSHLPSARNTTTKVREPVHPYW